MKVEGEKLKDNNRIERFEDLLVWQKAEELVLLVYNTFKYCKDYSFRNQIQSAAVSIMNNIAEGFERKGNKEYGRFLYIAKGSCGEVRSMLHLALKLKYIDQKNFALLYGEAVTVSKMLAGLIRKL